MIYISNELSHHGVKGMKWGVRHDRKNYKIDGRTPTRKEFRQIRKDEKEFNKEAKREYKYATKQVNKKSNEIFKTYVDAQTANRKEYSSYKKGQKTSLKNKEIDKASYKQNIKNARHNKFKANQQAEVNMAIGQYRIQKARHVNKMVYAQDIGNMKAYEKGKKAYYREAENFAWGNSMYTVKRKSDGSYSISRTDVYVY